MQSFRIWCWGKMRYFEYFYHLINCNVTIFIKYIFGKLGTVKVIIYFYKDDRANIKEVSLKGQLRKLHMELEKVWIKIILFRIQKKSLIFLHTIWYLLYLLYIILEGFQRAAQNPQTKPKSAELSGYQRNLWWAGTSSGLCIMG